MPRSRQRRSPTTTPASSSGFTEDAAQTAVKYMRWFQQVYPGLPVATTVEQHWSDRYVAVYRVAEEDWRRWLGLPAAGLLEVLLKDVPNPDLMYEQGNGTGYHDGATPGPREGRWAPAVNFFYAMATARQHIVTARLGSGNWAGGAVRLRGRAPRGANVARLAALGGILGRVSYNGRLWLPMPVAAAAMKDSPYWHTPELVPR